MEAPAAARRGAPAPAGKAADLDPLAPYDLAAGAGGSGDLSFLFGGPSDDGGFGSVSWEAEGKPAREIWAHAKSKMGRPVAHTPLYPSLSPSHTGHGGSTRHSVPAAGQAAAVPAGWGE